jgi:hypothetical protein
MSVFCLLLLTSVVIAAPVPTHLFPRTQPYYFPTTPGTKWVYESEHDKLALVISEVEQNEAGTLVTVDRVNGGEATRFQKVLVSTNGVIQTDFMGKTIPHPWVLLTVPYKEGDTWSDDDSDEFGFTASINRVCGVEIVKVPAGTYEAVKVDSEYRLKGQKITRSIWYAPHVGVVKITGSGTQVLKSFTPGKQ